MAFFDTLTVLNALKAKLEALTWTPEAGDPEPAFKKVELFDISELALALEELRDFKDRVCIVILESEQFDNEKTKSATKFMSVQTRTVALLISDRNFGRRIKALAGTDGAPGVLKLKDIVLNGDGTNESALGLLPGLKVVVKPTQGVFVSLRGKEREDLPGRLVWEQDLELRGGYVEMDTGPGPMI